MELDGIEIVDAARKTQTYRKLYSPDAMPLRELSERTGVHFAQLSRSLRYPARHNLTTRNVVRLALVLGVPLSDLLTYLGIVTPDEAEMLDIGAGGVL